MSLPFSRKWALAKIHNYVDSLPEKGIGIKRVRKRLVDLLTFLGIKIGEKNVLVFKYKNDGRKFWKIIVCPLFGAELILFKYPNEPLCILN